MTGSLNLWQVLYIVLYCSYLWQVLNIVLYGKKTKNTYHVLYCCPAKLNKILKWLQYTKEFWEGEWSICRSKWDTQARSVVHVVSYTGVFSIVRQCFSLWKGTLCDSTKNTYIGDFWTCNIALSPTTRLTCFVLCKLTLMTCRQEYAPSSKTLLKTNWKNGDEEKGGKLRYINKK